ncbi:MAG: VWA domain-containing protein, partial [Planctomycetes bacterium]|nr:VWA domain-containing protein [Planctomycetota bacterium]
MRLESPYWLVAAALVALAVALRLALGLAHGSRPALLFSRIPEVLRSSPTWRTRLHGAFGIVRILVLLGLIFALSRPQEGRTDSVITSDGIDIMLVVDTSQSMIAEDFGKDRTRLDHVVEVMREFVERRPDDRIGLVSFGRYAYTRCPMTLDHGLLSDFLEQLHEDWAATADSLARKTARRGAELTPAEEDLTGTAIGDGLIGAISRLQKSDAKSRIIILLSDGESNAGETTPDAAAELAARFGIKVYTVGAGSNGNVYVTVYDNFGRRRKQATSFRLDEATLKKIAETTKGEYFPARDRNALEETFKDIDRLERSEIETRDYREWEERFPLWAWLALGLLLFEFIMRST